MRNMCCRLTGQEVDQLAEFLAYKFSADEDWQEHLAASPIGPFPPHIRPDMMRRMFDSRKAVFYKQNRDQGFDTTLVSMERSVLLPTLRTHLDAHDDTYL
jgi:hypothetical protein